MAIDCIIYPKYSANAWSVISDIDHMIGSKFNLSKSAGGPLVLTALEAKESLIVTQIGIMGM